MEVTSSIKQIPIKHYKRETGCGNHNLYRSFKIWLNVATGFSTSPLHLTTLWVFLCLHLLLFTALVLILWRFIPGGEAPEGWATIVLIVKIIGGIQLAALGIIGEYIGRIFLNNNQRLQYAIKETKNIRL